jgi:hypothetical protein
VSMNSYDFTAQAEERRVKAGRADLVNLEAIGLIALKVRLLIFENQLVKKIKTSSTSTTSHKSTVRHPRPTAGKKLPLSLT